MDLKYSKQPKDKTIAVTAMARDLNISFKDSVVVCKFLNGMMLEKAIQTMSDVEEKKTHVPYTRFKTGVGHRKGTLNKVGKYPVKPAKYIKMLLRSLETNAEYKGLDPANLKITHLQPLKGRGILKRRPKGRWKAWTTQYVNIQAIAEEVE